MSIFSPIQGSEGVANELRASAGIAFGATAAFVLANSPSRLNTTNFKLWIWSAPTSAWKFVTLA